MLTELSHDSKRIHFDTNGAFEVLFATTLPPLSTGLVRAMQAEFVTLTILQNRAAIFAVRHRKKRIFHRNTTICNVVYFRVKLNDHSEAGW